MLNLQILNNCEHYPTAPGCFSIALQRNVSVGTFKNELCKKLGYEKDSFEIHLSPKDEMAHAELFSRMTDVKPFFLFFFSLFL
jgi:hypothetical protein